MLPYYRSDLSTGLELCCGRTYVGGVCCDCLQGKLQTLAEGLHPDACNNAIVHSMFTAPRTHAFTVQALVMVGHSLITLVNTT